MISRLYFFLIVAFIGMAGGLGQWLMYRRALHFLQPKWTLAIFLLMPLIFALPNLCGGFLPRLMTKLFAWIGGYWLIFFYYSFLLMLAYFLLYLGCLLFSQQSFWQLFAGKFAGLGLFLLLIPICWGAWNAFHPVYREVEVITEKPLPRDLKIAFVSDIHLGAILGNGYSRELSKKIHDAKPDLILFGGDLIDGDLNFVAEDGSYTALAKLRAPLGVYGVYGNHDYIGENLPAETEMFDNIRFLKDETVRIGDALEITGLDDYAYGTKNSPPKIDAGKSQPFRLLVDHEPWRIMDAAKAGYDLYLAGHTHAGQFFPNRLVTQKLYALDYGSQYFGDMLAIVSNGYGFWGTPVRIGPAPEIVLIHLKNK